MRRGLVALLALLIGGAIATQAAGVGPRRASASKAGLTVQVKIPLPGPESASFGLLTVKATASHGAVGSLSVRSLDETQLPSGIRAIAVITPRVSHKPRATFKVYIGINDLTAPSAGVASLSSEPPPLRISIEDVDGTVTTFRTEYFKFPANCGLLVGLGQDADVDPQRVKEVGLARQTSKPEEILDHLAYDRYHCPGAEVPDEGEK